MKKTTAVESRSQAFKRITDGIRNYMNHTVGVMKLIQEAKHLEIWKEKYSSWQEYCETEFGKSRQRAYQLLEIAGTIEEVSTAYKSVNPVDTESGKNKEILQNLTFRQASALKGLEPQQKAEVLDAAIKKEGGKSPKPATIAKVRRSAFAPDQIQRNHTGAYTSAPASNGEPIRRDKVGREIPAEILAEWGRAHEVGTKLRSMVSDVKCALQKGLEGKTESDKDIIFRELSNSIISEAEALHYSLSQILPHAVCPKCQGKTRNTCAMCRQRGFVSKFYWDGPAVGNDLRNVIKRQYDNSQTLSA